MGVWVDVGCMRAHKLVSKAASDIVLVFMTCASLCLCR